MPLLTTLQAGRAGVVAASAGIQATAENATNVNTPGFVRRRADQASGASVQRGGFLLGQGPEVRGFLRGVDRLLTSRRIQSAGFQSRASTRAQALEVLQSWVSVTGSSDLRAGFDGVMESFDGLTADPSDLARRRELLASLSEFGAQVQTIAKGFTSAMEDFSSQVVSAVPDVQTRLDEVASLNAQIISAGGDAQGGALADRRDQILRELGEEIGTTVRMEPTGEATVLLGGHAVVSGVNARQLTASLDSDGNPQLSLETGSSTIDVTALVGGRMGGAVDGRQLAADQMVGLDKWVSTFADGLNAAQAAGFTAAGAPGAPLITYDPLHPAESFEVSAAVSDDPSLLALASGAGGLPGDGGNLSSFLDLGTSVLLPSGETLGAGLSSWAADLGTEIKNAELDAERQGAVLSDLDSIALSRHGVDPDEEAVNLVRYQQAYQASARVISAADTLLQTLMELA